MPASGATLTGFDHVSPPSVDRVKYSYAGVIAYVVVSVMP